MIRSNPSRTSTRSEIRWKSSAIARKRWLDCLLRDYRLSLFVPGDTGYIVRGIEGPAIGKEMWSPKIMSSVCTYTLIMSDFKYTRKRYVCIHVVVSEGKKYKTPFLPIGNPLNGGSMYHVNFPTSTSLWVLLENKGMHHNPHVRVGYWLTQPVQTHA